ncbi:hypothetical protein ACRALDRAFT_212905 [Sodiomyces alcalophilus JCM 7366]|uniref:uncharacterized protein n=1 Tax=Sodiomyces alcalophilus JCM 7366 TaxID=591952 RepID=UPI0039B66705
MAMFFREGGIQSQSTTTEDNHACPNSSIRYDRWERLGGSGIFCDGKRSLCSLMVYEVRGVRINRKTSIIIEQFDLLQRKSPELRRALNPMSQQLVYQPYSSIGISEEKVTNVYSTTLVVTCLNNIQREALPVLCRRRRFKGMHSVHSLPPAAEVS